MSLTGVTAVARPREKDLKGHFLSLHGVGLSPQVGQLPARERFAWSLTGGDHPAQTERMDAISRLGPVIDNADHYISTANPNPEWTFCSVLCGLQILLRSAATREGHNFSYQGTDPPWDTFTVPTGAQRGLGTPIRRPFWPSRDTPTSTCSTRQWPRCDGLDVHSLCESHPSCPGKRSWTSVTRMMLDLGSPVRRRPDKTSFMQRYGGIGHLVPAGRSPRSFSSERLRGGAGGGGLGVEPEGLGQATSPTAVLRPKVPARRL